MQMISCDNGHYYDNKKHESCPYCKVTHIILLQQQKSKYYNSEKIKLAILEAFSLVENKVKNAKIILLNVDIYETSRSVHESMISNLRKSNIVIAEVSELNTHTMYELGMAHAMGIPIIMFKSNKSQSQVPQDLMKYSYLTYDTDDFQPLIYNLAQKIEVFTNDIDLSLLPSVNFNNPLRKISNDAFKTMMVMPDEFDTEGNIDNEDFSEGYLFDRYKVKHKYLNKIFALKVLNRKGKEKKEIYQPVLFKEVRELSILMHSNVVSIIDASSFEDTAYILMEYIEEIRLDLLLDKWDRFSENKTLDLLEDMAILLVEQEKHNIVHSDIKPQNIFLKNENFCMIDYGGTPFGAEIFMTPEYASPEQLNNQSDLYSLGITAWQCITGEFPKGCKEWEYNIPPLKNYTNDLSDEFIKIIENLLAIDTKNRYSTAKELLSDIYTYRYDGEAPVGKVRGSVFVAIAYRDTFESVYNTLNITAKNMNFKCIRMDRKHFKDEIWKNIAMEIELADIIIADFSESEKGCGVNPNVITKASHARAKGKELILITQGNPKDLPFDWRYLPVIKYTDSDKGLTELSKKISHKLRVIHNL